MMNAYLTANNKNNKGGDGKVIPPGNRKHYMRLYFFLVVLLTVMIIFNNERLLNPIMDNYKDSELGSSPSLSSLSSIDKDKKVAFINFDVDVDVDGSDNNNNKEWGNSSSSLSSSSSSVDTDKNITVGSTSDMVISNNDEEKQNNNDEDGDDDDRPWLILHVGPPKTATTTIQHSFEKIAAQLAKDDNYYYIGQTLKTKESEIIKSLGPTMNDKANITIFEMSDFIYTHSKEFLDKLQYYHDNKRNVIISSEFYTSKLLHLKKNFDKIFNEIFLRKNNTRQQQQQQQQQQDSATAEKLFGFKIKIVVGYRHFFEWLPSYYHQRHLRNAKDTPNEKTKISNDNTLLYPYEGYIPGMIAYVEWFLRDLVQYDPVEDDKNNNNNTNANNNNNRRNNINHTSFDGIFINSRQKELQKKVHGSIYSYLMWSSQLGLYDRVEIFDMHQQEYNINNSSMTTNNEPEQQHLFANFVCQILPSATNTCRHLGEQTDDEEFSKRVRKPKPHKLLSRDDMYRIIQAARMKKLSLTPEFKSSHYVTIPTGEKINNGIMRWLNNNKNKQQNIASSGSSGSNNRNITTTNTNGSSNDLYGHHELKRCLKSESAQQLKVASWNFLLQQVLLVRMHNKSRRKQQRRSQSQSNSNLIELSSTKTDHLILSSQYPTRDDDDNNNKNGDDDSWIIHIKTEHDKSFNEYVSTGAFCEVDIEKVFSNEEFLNTVIFPPRPARSVITSF